jgi:hypothetical protein
LTGGEFGTGNAGSSASQFVGEILDADGCMRNVFTQMKTWTERLGRSPLRTFTDEHNHFWLEQNPDKASKWAKLVREGHEMAWEFDSPGGSYTGRMLIDGEIYTPSEATKKFLKGDAE